MRISELFGKNPNNFNFVRLVLASSVMFTHSYWVTTHVEATDPLVPYLGKAVSTYAVDGFFFLSGLLVYGSLLRRSSLPSFLIARLSRLWPGLAVSVLLTVAVGGLLSSVHGGAYFHGDTLKFLSHNLVLRGGGYSLTGLTCDGEPCNINGSLWTISWEVNCYLTLAVLFLLRLSSEKAIRTIVLPATFAFALLWHFVPHAAGQTGGWVYALDTWDRLWTMFALGVAAYAWRDQIPLSWPIAAALFAASLAERHFGLHLHLDSLFTAYFVLCLGLLTAKTSAFSANWPDYSYGLYIYAFPVMMLLAHSFHFANFALLAAANFLGTLPLAALSWHLVEKPMIERSKGWQAHWAKPKAPAIA